MIRQIPGVDWTIDNVVAGLLNLTNEITQDWIWTEGVFREYREAGHAVSGPEDVRRLDLEEVDNRIGSLKNKYRALATAEGAATGYAGAAGIVPDIIALVGLNLRAAGEYATYCGFDISDERERVFALKILDEMARPHTKAERLAATPAVMVSRRLASRQSMDVLEQVAASRAIQNLTRALGINLSKAKLAQLAPVSGALIGGTFNGYYTGQVCDTAFFTYRERFLVAKYGPDVFDQAVS
jgi:hypothetical protein